MAETVGMLIVGAIAPGAITGIGFGSAISGASFLGVSLVTGVGTAALLGASIGLQYALNNKDVPKPEGGAQPLKQAIPPRQRGYWVNRLSGYYMLFMVANHQSLDMIAFHSGPIEEVLQLYLHDVPVSVDPPMTHGAVSNVLIVGEMAYQGVQIQAFYWRDDQNSADLINETNSVGVWTSAMAGKGIACLGMACAAAEDAEQFTKMYPQGLPLPSVVAKCSPIWNPRDPSQSRSNRATWKASPNPVLQLINYLTEPDGGMGEGLDDILPPATLAQWMEEANICDEDVGGRSRYLSAGWYQFDNSPENVINKILATCDGWLCEGGDGSLVLTVGKFRTPTDPPITDKHLVGYTLAYGQADEDTINQLDISFTNPDSRYASYHVASIRDEESISRSGIVRAQPLELSWVQNGNQAIELGRRAMLRLNPELSGTLTTTLYGLRYLGKRWVKVQIPTIRGLEDCVVEIQDRATVDLRGGCVTFKFNTVNVAAMLASRKREGDGYTTREGGGLRIRETL